MSNNQSSSELQVQIRLIPKHEGYVMSSVPISVPSSIQCEYLNELVHQLLKDNKTNIVRPKYFDFLVFGDLLRIPLMDHLQERGISADTTTIDIEYFERVPEPESQISVFHNDWVSGIHTTEKFILTGCYDNSVNIWNTCGKFIMSSKKHTNVIKQVAWLKQDDPSKGFVSVSHDATGILYDWEAETDTIEPQIILRGHEKGINSVGVSLNSQLLATGGQDTDLKVWSASFEQDDGEPAYKKVKGPKIMMMRTPLHTLKGHKETISAVNWIDDHVISTVSMDQTIKFWDAEQCDIKNEIVGERAFLSCSWSPLCNMILTSSADRHIRLYDPRSIENSTCQITFTSHKLWVTSVCWSNYDEHLFISGSYDASVKMWDARSPNTPLHSLDAHEGQVLVVDWSNNKYIISGGSDNSMHIFNNKDER